MFAHIDGDIIKYRAGFGAEKGEYALTYPDAVGDEMVKTFKYKKDLDAYLGSVSPAWYSVEFRRIAEPVSFALQNVRTTVRSILERLQPDDFAIYLSGSSNFRNSIATIKGYKANRNPAHKPVHSAAIVDYLTANYSSNVSVDEEADDVIGYTHYEMWEQDPYSSVICSTDKDLNLIPGLHYNFVKQFYDDVSPQQADYNFWLQLLTGDTTDNIQGVPGIGKMKAEKLLRSKFGNNEALYEIVKAQYETPEALIENARLLWIRRHKGELWTPELLNAVH